MKPSRSSIVLCVALLCCPLGRMFAGDDTYPRIEASFNINGISTDPAVLFDYAQTDVRADIVQPDGSVMNLPAFYDGGTTWRVRHTPTLPGTYAITNFTLNGSPIAVSNLQPTQWVVAGFPTREGYVRLATNNLRRFMIDDGRRFFPIGENVAWDIGSHKVTNIFSKMGAAHLNWSRVWMDHWDGKNLDWNNDGSPPGPLGVLNLAVARKWDSIVTAAERAGIHFQMTLQHHGQYSTTTDPNWGQNPYNVADPASSIGFLTSPVQFFTNTTAKTITKRKIRYIIARWGYSPAIMAYELFNEVQYTTAGHDGLWSIIQSWHNEMAQFIRAQDPYHHLITTSSALNKPIWDEMDYYQHHDYPSGANIISGLRNATDISLSQPIRPDFGGECGTNGTPGLGVNAPVWAGLMAGQSGNEQPWYWDAIDAENDYPYFRSASDFVARSGLGNQEGVRQSAPAVSSIPAGQLSAYAVGNQKIEAIYVWSPANVFDPAASNTATGTLAVSGLAAGTYRGVWWNTFAGGAITNFTFTVPVPNTSVTVTTPPVLRSVALYVGIPEQAGITAPPLSVSVATNSPPFVLPITLTNSGGLPLGYSLSVTGISPVVYCALDSTRPGGPSFTMDNLAGVGRDITTNFTALAPPKGVRDEGIAGPIDIGFPFPFFSGSQTPALFSSVYVSPNGFITFSPFAGDTSVNTPFPSTSAPANCIAALWTDLDASASSCHVFTDSDPIRKTFTVQFLNLRLKGTTTTVNCQIILKPTGEILLEYAGTPITSPYTIGLQDNSAGQGLTVAFNTNYLQSDFAVQLTPAPWLTFSSFSGLVPAAGAEKVQVGFSAGGLPVGNYNATLLVKTSDSLLPVTAMPVSLAVTPQLSGLDAWRQEYFGTTNNTGAAADTADPDGDGLINILEYAFNLDPHVPNPNPITLAVVSGHLEVTYHRAHPAPADIDYIAEVSGDLSSNLWNSGPAYTSQTVTNNGDGTETVTVTDLAPYGSSPAHFLRIRIAH